MATPRSVTCKACFLQGQALFYIANKIPCHPCWEQRDQKRDARPSRLARTSSSRGCPLRLSAGPPFPAREQWLGQREARRFRHAPSCNAPKVRGRTAGRPATSCPLESTEARGLGARGPGSSDRGLGSPGSQVPSRGKCRGQERKESTRRRQPLVDICVAFSGCTLDRAAREGTPPEGGVHTPVWRAGSRDQRALIPGRW